MFCVFVCACIHVYLRVDVHPYFCMHQHKYLAILIPKYGHYIYSTRMGIDKY